MSLPLRFGPHQLDSVLAGGQSGLLFQARELEGAARAVVLKIPYVYLQRTPGFRSAFLERLQPFAERQCPGLVRVLGTGKTHGLAWVSTEPIQGVDMGTLLQQMQSAGRRPTPRQVLTVGLRLGNILSALHAAPGRSGPMVHAELRPSKVVFTPDGAINLLPPGAVTTAASERGPSGSAARFAWRAPEQLMRVPESVRTDVRGLALLLLVLATGSNPFQRRTSARTLSAILQDQVMLEGDSELTPELSGLLRDAMASDPDRRPKDVPAFLEALRTELTRLGGEAKAWEWRGFVEAVRQAPPPPASADDARLVAEREALLARLVRDSRRAEPGETAAVAVPGDPRPGEPSGFTLVPEDHEPITQETEAEGAPLATILNGAISALDQLQRDENTEDEDTAEGAASRERAPMPRHAEAVFAAAGAEDSSFVLVEDNARQVATPLNVVGGAGNPAVPDGRVMSPPMRADDEDSIPTLEADDGQRSAIVTAPPPEVRAADTERTPAQESRLQPPLVSIAPVVAPPPSPRPPPPVEPPRRADASVDTVPTRAPSPASAVTEIPAAPRAPVISKTAPPGPPRIRPTERPPTPSRAPTWIGAVIVLVAAGAGIWTLTRGPAAPNADDIRVQGPATPSEPQPTTTTPGPAPETPTTATNATNATPPEPAPTTPTAPATAPPAEPTTTAAAVVASNPATTTAKNPTSGTATTTTTQQKTKATTTTQPRTPEEPTPAPVTGDPTVTSLSPKIDPNRVTITVKGVKLGRPNQELVSREGDGDQYIFRLEGVASSLGWRHQAINSDLVTGVEVLASEEGTQIRVNTGTAPYNVNYMSTPDGFKFAVIRKQ